ncbi:MULTISPECIES: tRNA pseudouridine(55) synthase TruB [unclassified Arenibacter]|jgi:tRNA pseudouridine55 synthase|uniref:tRNA pseudouridine(55) synthase TruB n=1 Tax=unclassified Arenibacter TaxID=2615047 RepID=UPI000E34B8A6|nr:MULTISPECIES: tRNA pseudouridine(55) synthase TruB [unclassified Arenibacter]MCM4163833.1 tRNA pseudouridine(55) synthase TruB [Arenibacter sp. A80]RFT56547.1 tRNA pseudouridine(55) synthase TruB [Arenibacter sp. P308M17]
MTKEDFLEGQVLLIDKPFGWSSFQAVNSLKWKIRKKFQLKKIKIGHAGTLDPLATGLLLICTGKSTKTINEIQGQKKEYTGTITLGGTTPSYDLETEINENFPIDHITKELIHSTAAQFIGDIEQIPPVFSALKKDGKRLYEYAREGKEVEIKKRKVTITEFEITAVELPLIHFRVVCSKGTYIRSLAHDLGKAMDSGAHLSSLKRTKIGDYNVNKALTPEEFGKLLQIDS